MPSKEYELLLIARKFVFFPKRVHTHTYLHTEGEKEKITRFIRLITTNRRQSYLST